MANVGDKIKKGSVEYTVKKKMGEKPEHNRTREALVLEGPDGVERLEKLPEDRLSVKVIIEIQGKLRRADLDRFTQSMSKTVSFEFEDGGNGV